MCIEFLCSENSLPFYVEPLKEKKRISGKGGGVKIMDKGPRNIQGLNKNKKREKKNFFFPFMFLSFIGLTKEIVVAQNTWQRREREREKKTPLRIMNLSFASGLFHRVNTIRIFLFLCCGCRKRTEYFLLCPHTLAFSRTKRR